MNMQDAEINEDNKTCMEMKMCRCKMTNKKNDDEFVNLGLHLLSTDWRHLDLLQP